MFLALFSVRLRNRLRRLPFWRSSAARPDPEAVKAAPKRNGRMVLAILAAALVGSLLVKIELRVAGSSGAADQERRKCGPRSRASSRRSMSGRA